MPETALCAPPAVRVRPTPTEPKAAPKPNVRARDLVEAASGEAREALGTLRVVPQQRVVEIRERACRGEQARSRYRRRARRDRVARVLEVSGQIRPVEHVALRAEPIGVRSRFVRLPGEVTTSCPPGKAPRACCATNWRSTALISYTLRGRLDNNAFELPSSCEVVLAISLDHIGVPNDEAEGWSLQDDAERPRGCDLV